MPAVESTKSTVTAANAQLLASMLDLEQGPADPELPPPPGSARSTRMRREVRSTRDIETEQALDSHVTSLSRPGSGRDSGGETRRRAKELSERESRSAVARVRGGV